VALRTISLFAGLGCIDYALREWCRTVCYVEREAYAAAVLVARMADEALDHAPVWDDVTTFDGLPWRGKVDLVSGGFPCQDISVAGKGSSRRFSLDTSSLRTSKRSSRAGSKPSSGTLPLSGSMRNGVCSARPRSAPHTSESDCLFWPTPSANRYRSSNNGNPHDYRTEYATKGKPSLWTMTSRWPTPNQRDYKDSATQGRRRSPNLGTQVLSRARWPTPNARDWKGPPGAGCPSRGGRQASLPTQIGSANGMALNPQFVEALMGLPIGWSACVPLVTASSRNKPEELSSSCGAA
jgi:hypothetical protein